MHEHIHAVQAKVNQRMEILKRLKHLLPPHIRKIYVTSMILPILEYASLAWGDKGNKVAMDSLQVLHNKAAKLILNRPMYSSSSDALATLNWLDLSTRRTIQRCCYVYNNLTEGNKSYFISGSDVHHYDTHHKDRLRTLKSNTNKGLLTSHNSFLKDWNILSQDLKTLPTLPRFKKALFKQIRKSSSNVFWAFILSL